MSAFECPFSFHARTQPDAIACTYGTEKWTYRTCHAWINGLVVTLRKNKVTPGTCIAVYPDKTALTPLILFALFRLNAIAFPLNAYLPPAAMKNQLATARAFLFLHPNSAPQSDLHKKSLSFGDLKRQTSPISHSVQTFLQKQALATYLTTSGTTTTPKIAALSLGNHYYSAIGSNGTLPSLQDRGHWLLSLPLYHIAGIAILFRTFLSGATLVLPTSASFNPTEIASQPISHLSLVPTQLYRLFDLPLAETKALMSHLKCVLLGGSAIVEELYSRGIAHGFPLYPTYGMTEMSSQITTATDRAAAFFSLGHPLPYRSCKIAVDGEIKVTGKTLFQGYLTRDHALDRPLDPQGYFSTRDLGRYSPQVGLRFLGRKDRLFISGGENIHPEEIEHALMGIHGILDACVTPIKDEEFGMRPLAHIHTNQPMTPQRIKEILATKLPKYKIPIDFLPLKK
ncbi:MAG: o-succinylbenzoate--CoA ligase [Chlamydiota bacterium]